MALTQSVSFAEGSLGTGAPSLSASMSRTRKLLSKAEEAIAQTIPEEADTGPGLQWLSVAHWEESMTEELMALGAALMADGQIRSASRCYGRAYEIARQPVCVAASPPRPRLPASSLSTVVVSQAPPKKDPFDPDPEPIRRAKWWPCETQCRSALCVGEHSAQSTLQAFSCQSFRVMLTQRCSV